jgi:hypothetical protein
MAIKSRGIFGGVTLTGKDAEAFIEQFVNNPKPNPLAQAALDRGMEQLEEFQSTGKITVETRIKNKGIINKRPLLKPEEQ